MHSTLISLGVVMPVPPPSLDSDRGAEADAFLHHSQGQERRRKRHGWTQAGWAFSTLHTDMATLTQSAHTWQRIQSQPSQ